MAWINVIAVLISPIIAVQITRYFDNRKLKIEKKYQLFSIIMGQRGLLPRTDEFLISLNMIDVVFNENKDVRTAYQEFYRVSATSHPENYNSGKKLIVLLQEMAKVLKYNIRDLDIDSNFVTTERIVGTQMINEYYSEFIRVLKNSKNFGECKKDLEK